MRATAEKEKGRARLRIRVGEATLAEARFAPRDWPSDPVLQTKLLCRKMKILRESSSLELLEAARGAVERALAVEVSTSPSQTAGDRSERQRGETGNAPSDNCARRTSCATLPGHVRQMLLKADLEQGALRLPDARFRADLRLSIILSEMYGLGLLFEDRRRLTPEGMRGASELQQARAAREEEFARGISFAQYQAGDGALLSEWTTASSANGERLYGDERFICKGETPTAARRAQPLPNLAARWTSAMLHTQREVEPVAFTGEAESRLVWFSDGTAVPACIFDHVARGSSDFTFTTSVAGGETLNVYRFGERIATIESCACAVPEGVRLCMRTVGSGKPVQQTIYFSTEFAAALGLPPSGLDARQREDYLLKTPIAEYFGYSTSHLAVINDDLRRVREAVYSGETLEERVEEFGDTMLMQAAESNRFRLALFLLCHGAKASARNARGITALMIAAAEGSVDMVCLIALFLEGLPPEEGINAQDNDGNTAMHWAAREGRRLVVDCLRWLGARKDIRNVYGCTPEEEAIEFNHPTTAEACRGVKVKEPRLSAPEIKEVLRVRHEMRMARLDLEQSGAAALDGREAGAVAAPPPLLASPGQRVC